jgi:catechol 2,3-dioxygenase-like lactoylglutathione lyase family enzyme
VSQPTRLTHFSPIFPVKDLQRALAHYESLGFVTHAYGDGDEYGYADRDGIGLHLAVGHGHDPGAEGIETYLYVEDADALYDEWTRAGIGGITRHVRDTPYQLREGAHIDPDGNVIRFGSPLPGLRKERLQSHLESRYGIGVTQLSELDVRVFRVDRRDGPSWVARLFPAVRPAAVVAGDAEILAFLAEHDFPAERRATTESVSALDGRAVLVTEYVAMPAASTTSANCSDGSTRCPTGRVPSIATEGLGTTWPTAVRTTRSPRPPGCWGMPKVSCPLESDTSTNRCAPSSKPSTTARTYRRP